MQPTSASVSRISVVHQYLSDSAPNVQHRRNGSAATPTYKMLDHVPIHKRTQEAIAFASSLPLVVYLTSRL